eukprot:5981005-Alexandrium_andersonii.AAC.1
MSIRSWEEWFAQFDESGWDVMMVQEAFLGSVNQSMTTSVGRNIFLFSFGTNWGPAIAVHKRWVGRIKCWRGNGRVGQ